MTRHNRNPSRECIELVEDIEAFADTHGRNDTTRAIADALEDDLRERFKQSYGVDRTSDGSNCIGRLITGSGNCQHGGLRPKGDDSDHPPHQPPHADHSDLWLRDGEPAAFTMHLYDLHRDELRDIVDFADEWGLEVAVDPSSWYFPTRTSHIVFHHN